MIDVQEQVNTGIAAVLVSRWVELKEREAYHLAYGENSTARILHIRADEGIMLALKFEVLAEYNEQQIAAYNALEPNTKELLQKQPDIYLTA